MNIQILKVNPQVYYKKLDKIDDELLKSYQNIQKIKYSLLSINQNHEYFKSKTNKYQINKITELPQQQNSISQTSQHYRLIQQERSLRFSLYKQQDLLIVEDIIFCVICNEKFNANQQQIHLDRHKQKYKLNIVNQPDKKLQKQKKQQQLKQQLSNKSNMLNEYNQNQRYLTEYSGYVSEDDSYYNSDIRRSAGIKSQKQYYSFKKLNKLQTQNNKIFDHSNQISDVKQKSLKDNDFPSKNSSFKIDQFQDKAYIKMLPLLKSPVGQINKKDIINIKIDSSQYNFSHQQIKHNYKVFSKLQQKQTKTQQQKQRQRQYKNQQKMPPFHIQNMMQKLKKPNSVISSDKFQTIYKIQDLQQNLQNKKQHKNINFLSQYGNNSFESHNKKCKTLEPFKIQNPTNKKIQIKNIEFAQKSYFINNQSYNATIQQKQFLPLQSQKHKKGLGFQNISKVDKVQSRRSQSNKRYKIAKNIFASQNEY